MSSTSLWFVIVWVAIVAFLADMFGGKKFETNFGVIEEHYKWFSAILMIIPALYYAATRTNVGDTSAYQATFSNIIPSINYIKEIMMADGKDKGFTIFSTFIKFFIGNQPIIYFFIISFICLIALVYVYRKYSTSYAISLFLFFASTDYIEWICNGMRQFIAVAILFGCIGYILKKKYANMIIIIFIMSTIHATALIMLPVIFVCQGEAWNRYTLLFIILILVAIYYINGFTSILEELLSTTQYKDVVQQFAKDDGINILRVLVYAMPTIISLIFKKRLKKVATPLNNLCINMSILSTGFYVLGVFTSGIYVGRIPIYFSLYNYILLPWELNNIFEIKSRRFIYMVMIIFYLLFYYYQVFIAWGM